MSIVWHCVRTNPSMDVRVARDFWSQGYEAFIAWTFSKQISGGRNVVVTEIRLPGYVFVARDPDAGRGNTFQPIADTLHVADVLRSFRGGERQPLIVPAAVIDGLRRDQIEDFEAAVRRVRRKESIYHKDDIVRIHEGIASGLSGPVSGARHGSVVVDIDGWPWRVPEESVTLVREAPSAATAGAA